MTILMPLWPMANTGVTSADDRRLTLLCFDGMAGIMLYDEPTQVCDDSLDSPSMQALP